MPTVYIETTIPSYYYETRSSAQIIAWRDATRRWWTQHRSAYELVTSALTLNELAATPGPKARLCLALLADVRLLPEPKGLIPLIDHYVKQKLMPAGEGGDAGHLAYASLHNVEFLLTWNCTHLANANKVRHL